MIDNNNQMIDELKSIIYQIEKLSKKDKKIINDRNQLMEWWNLFWRKAKEIDIRPLYSILDELPVTFVLDFLPKKGEVDSEQINEQKVFSLLLDFKKILNELDYIGTKEEAIAVVARIFVEVAKIAKMLFHKNLSEILEDNILKLRSRYPEGFDVNVANVRIDFNKTYKEDENYGISKGKRLTRDY